jgi:mannose-6-phosphate isomerase-like protein (cupin superfamily)
MTAPWHSRHLGATPDVTAPDGSEVRLLATSARGSMAEFTLQPGQVSVAMRHATVEELWLFTHGTGKFWRRSDTVEEIVSITPGLSLSIPPGTSFQFRCDGGDPLRAVAVTMPPWPGPEEAQAVPGRWPAAV